MIEPTRYIRCYHSREIPQKSHYYLKLNEKTFNFFVVVVVTRGTTTTGKKEPFGECEIKASYEISEGIRKVKKE